MLEVSRNWIDVRFAVPGLSRNNRNPRKVRTLKGEYEFLERVKRFKNERCKGHEISFRSRSSSATVCGRTIGLDVIIFAGSMRYEWKTTSEEIIDFPRDFEFR